MRKSVLALLAFIISICQAHAQRELKNPLINSKEVINAGYKLYEEGKLKEALKEYYKVPASDTNYAVVLHEIILTQYKDSNFVEAEKNSKLGLSLFPEKKQDWYGFLANIYDDSDKTDLAISIYDSIIKENPFNYLSWFNKGISQFRKERMDDAAQSFKKCIMINPYYSSAHYYMGYIAMSKGNFVPAYMGFAMCLTISPSTKYKNSIITNLTTMSQVNTAAAEFLQKYKPGKEDNFDDVQEIIVSKVALDKGYKYKAGLEDPIVKQLQVMMEKLEYKAADKGFYMQYYAPLFKQVWDKGHFEAMVFNMFSDLDIKKVKDYMSKEKKAINAFSNEAMSYLNELRESQELQFTKRKDVKTRYYFSEGAVAGKGEYGKYKNENVVIGPWEFYHSNGLLKSRGQFNEEGNRNGDWTFFYDTGIMSEKTRYENGKAQGASDSWNDNGLPYRNNKYSNDLKEGEETNFYYSGIKHSVINYKADKQDGPAKYFDEEGNLKSTHTYVDEMQDGKSTFYHPNGKIKSVAIYKKDKAIGEYKEYYDNGELQTEGSLIEGDKNGVWTGYYKGKQVEYKENYVKGKLDGENIYYHKNGKLAYKKNYKKGDIEGKTESYDDDGILASEIIYEKGRLRDIKFFDKKGTVISNTTSRKGNANISFYTPEGRLSSEGYYTKDGLADGEFKYYFKNGKLSAKVNYKDGNEDGKKVFFYPNGKVKQEAVFKDDVEDGYLVDYYIDGTVSAEGWYKEGKAQGTHLGYNLLGNLSYNTYYINSKQHGISEYYSPSGKISSKQYYSWGWFYKIEQFDSTGKLLASSTLDKGAGKVKFVYPDGKLNFESNYKNYKLNGLYKSMNGDGSKKSESYYKNGNSDSTYTAWHPNGKIAAQGNYKDGRKDGVWKYFNFQGTQNEVENFNADGKLEGKNTNYNEDGTVKSVYTYKDGELEQLSHFGDNNELMVTVFFKDDIPTGYTYNDKAGKPVPVIPISHGSGKVEAFYKNGQKSAEFSYVEDVLNGAFNLYYTNGKPKTQLTYINGLFHGDYKTYYLSGKVKRSNNYLYGNDHGNFKYYNEDGSLISDTNYFLDTQHGEAKYYTNGKLSTTYIYDYGDLLSKK